MKRSTLIATVVVATSLFVSQAVFAAPASINSPVHAMFAKTKTVQISLRNDSSAPMELKAGEEVIKLDAGKTVSLHLPAGTRIVTNDTTPTRPAGTLITEVQSYLSGTTIGIK